MHRLLILCLIAATTEGYRAIYRPQQSLPWGRNMYAAKQRHVSAYDAAKEVKSLLFKANSMMQQFCTAYTYRPLVEAYGEKHYKLRVDLSKCDEADIKIRAGQRMASVQADDCNYMALRLLPEIVDSNQSFWRMANGHVTIFFPYTAEGGRCGRIISSEVHELPRLYPGTEDPETDARFGLQRGMLKDLLDN